MNKVRIESQKDLEDIFTAYNGQVYGYVYIRTGYMKELAEDLTQEIFLKLWDKRGDYDHKKSSIKTWIYTIARNLIIDEYRKKKDEMLVVDIDVQTVEIEEEMIKDSMQHYILTKMLKLNDEEKELITLHYIQGFEIKEIAQIIDKSYGATKMAINRAINKLRGLCDAGK